MWIIGSSVIKDLEQYTDKVTGLSFADTVKEEVGTVSYHGELDLKISDLLQAVKHMLKTHTPPKIILFQCGENDQGAEMTREESEKMLEDMKIVKSEIPGVFLIWAQTLPAWHKPLLKRADVAKNQRRINHFMMQAICSDEISGGILYHYSLRVNQKNQYYQPATDQNLHLNLHGMRTLVGQMKAGIQYFIAGKGTIFPYITWPPIAFEDISPDFICMLNEEMIKDISNTMFNRMTKEQIQSLSSEQIEYFDPNQFSWLICPKFIASLSEEQLGKLSVFLFHLFSNSQIEMFSESVIEKLNTEVKDMIARRKEKIAKQELDAMEYDATMYCTSEGTYEGFDQGNRGRGCGRGRGRPFMRAWGRGGYNNWFNNSENWHRAGDEFGKPDEGFEHNDWRGRSRSGSRERYSHRSRHESRNRSSSRMSDDSSSSIDSAHRRRRKRHSRHRSHSSSSDSSSNSSSPRRRRRRSGLNERSRRGQSQGSNQAPPPLPFAVIPPPGIHFLPPVSVATSSCPIPPPALAMPPMPIPPPVSQANMPIPHQSRMPPSFFNPTTPPVTPFSQPPHFDGLRGGPPQIRFSPGPFNARPHPGPFMMPGPNRGPPPPHLLGPPCRPMFPGVMSQRGPEWQGPFPPHQFPPRNHRPPDEQAQDWKRQPMVNTSNLANLTEVKTQIENTEMSVPKKAAKERSPSSSPDLYGDV